MNKPTAILALLVASAALQACAPRLYQRSTVTLSTTASEDQLTVHYGELDGCLFRRQVPLEYIIRRPRYTLVARPLSATAGAPRLELVLQGAGLVLRFDEPTPAPDALYAEKGLRYVIDTGSLKAPVVDVTVYRGDEALGSEHLRLAPETCRVLSPTG